MQYNTDRLRRGALELGISLNDTQIDQFLTYYEMLIDRNRFVNLTTITKYDDVIDKHFLDSLCITYITSGLKNEHILDLGSGAGFPGIPLKIAFPEISVTLVDSLNKRVNFMNNVIEELHLADITAVHGRAEDLARQKTYRGTYDLVVSRAVANIGTLLEYCLPFVRTGGSFIAYKTADIEDEISQHQSATSLLGGKNKEIKHYHIPGTEYERSLIQIQKIKTTPTKYPRKAGIPSKDPL